MRTNVSSLHEDTTRYGLCLYLCHSLLYLCLSIIFVSLYIFVFPLPILLPISFNSGPTAVAGSSQRGKALKSRKVKTLNAHLLSSNLLQDYLFASKFNILGPHHPPQSRASHISFFHLVFFEHAIFDPCNS